MKLLRAAAALMRSLLADGMRTIGLSVPALLFSLQPVAAQQTAMHHGMPMQASNAPAAVKRMASGACARPAANSYITEPPSISSSGGGLTVQLSFQTGVDQYGRTTFCFLTPTGQQDPTLHVRPGDTLTVIVTNDTPQGMPMMTVDAPNCPPTPSPATMYASSVNLHFHGTNVTPRCGSDEVIKTLINSGQTFTYTLSFPKDEPPGLYWYHPHVHGISDPLVMGGATGALVVDGIETLQPSVAGMPQHTLVLRDLPALASANEGPWNCVIAVPFRDVSVNYVPVNSYQLSQKIVLFQPAAISVPPAQQQFWRVANAAADTILDLQMVYDGVPQTLSIVAIDGVPVNTQDGYAAGQPIAATHFRLPPASRVEFVVTTPVAGVKLARLMTSNIGTGPAGDCDPMRPLLQLQVADQTHRLAAAAPAPARPLASLAAGRRFAGLKSMPIIINRTLFFAEDATKEPEQFYMGVQGKPLKAFEPNDPPSIVTTQGTVEKWTVYNRTQENHEFHIHQIHFLVQSQDNFGPLPQAPAIVGQYLDMVEVPAWDGVPSHPYPSVTLLMDFRGDIAGQFVFHCHILNHEDLGMMAIIQVNPASTRPTAAKAKTS